MNSYAIIKLGPSQQKVSVGDVIITDKIEQDVGGKVIINDVYMTSDGENYTIGTPTVAVSVELEVIGHEKGDKVRIHKFKAKSRYHKTTGFRASLTRLKVLSIGQGNENEKETKIVEPTVVSKVKKEVSNKPSKKVV